MKTWRLVSGIINCALFVRIAYQSFAAGIYNFFSGNGQTSGTTGLLVGALILAGGIVSIIFQKGGKSGNIAIFTIYLIAALTGIFGYTMRFTDILMWGLWAGICAIIAAFALKTKYGETITSVANVEKIKIVSNKSRTISFIFFCVFFAISVLSTVFVITADVLTFVNPSALEEVADSVVYVIVGAAVVFGGIAHALAGKAFD